MPKTRSTALSRFRILNGKLRCASVQLDGANCEINNLEPFILHRRRLLGAAFALLAATTFTARGHSDGDLVQQPGSATRSTEVESNGLVRVQSNFTVKETMDRLEAELKARSMPMFARIDHANGAAEAGLQLRPTELLIFGSPKTGTPLMQENHTIGIDLPLKVLAFADAEGNTSLAYNDPHWIAQRHGLGASGTTTINAMTAVLESLAAKATQ